MAYYMDLFKANPLTDPDSSVLEDITGSATRTDITEDLVFAQPLPYRKRQLTNPDTVVVAAASEAVSNVSFVALFDAATDGNLLTYAALGTQPRTIGLGNPVQFDAMTLSFLYRNRALGTTFYVVTQVDGTVTIIPGGDVPAGALLWGDGNPLLWDSDYLVWG